MPRTVSKILEDDEKKADLGVTKEELEALQEEEDGSVIVDGDKKAPTPEETAEDLRKQLKEANEKLETEAAARKDAETRAQTAATTAGSAVQAQVVTQKAAIDSRVVAANNNLEAIKQQLKQATAANDTDAIVDLQDAMTNARYELNAAAWDKNKFVEWETAQKNRPAQRQQTGRAPGTYTTQEQAWIDAHPQFKTSKKFARLTKAAAAEAEGAGYPVDSAAYFRFIEDSLREEGLISEDGEPLSGAGRNTNEASTSVAAAPNRSGNGTAAVVNKNSKYPYLHSGFRIPSDWVEAAELQGFDDVKEYANMRLEEEAKSKGNN